MGLTAYHQKRDFRKSPEPEGTERNAQQVLRFVVQKHDASTLHFDFRLEVDGVLKSWAIPKGPSMDPTVRRLAVQVEDHPVEYGKFAGTIPEGSYGAGEVEIWDQGTYEAVGAGSLQESQQRMRQGLEKGKLGFTLHGSRLKGAFTLVRLNADNRKSWLLMKKKDEFAAGARQTAASSSGPASPTGDSPSTARASSSGRKGAGGRQKPPSGVVHRGKSVREDPEITSPEKLYWPEEGISKGALAEYYRTVAPYLVPHLLDRPHALHRQPNGIVERGFFQKNIRGGVPSWVETITVPAESTGQGVRYLVCTGEPSLLAMVNLGCIEINPWFSRTSSLDRPDVLVMDLDPEDVPFSVVVDVALAVRELLEKARVPSYPKTSGATGMHIYVPLHAAYGYDEVRDFAELLARIVHDRMPEVTSLERNPVKRKNKVYLDYLRNSFSQTLAAPYSVRPRPGAPVSTPLTWEEARQDLDPREFTMRSTPQRLARRGDLFRNVLGKGINLEACRKRLMSALALKPSRRSEG